MIRSLDIRCGERPLDGRRLAIHMAQATAPEATLIRPKRRQRSGRALLIWFFAPSFFVSVTTISLIAAWRVLRWGIG